MASPQKTDLTKLCDECGAIMKITMVEPLYDEPSMMQHTFQCEECLGEARFKFPKKKPA